MTNEWQCRRQMMEMGRRLFAQGLVAATDGNMSTRLGRSRILITPSGIALGELHAADMVVIDATGRTLAGHRKPSSEYLLHLCAYQERPDVDAVVHAHPPIANAFSFAGLTLEECVIPEVVATLGRIPTTAYGTPSTPEGPQVARQWIRTHDAILLERHGSLTVGKTLIEAVHKLEKIEHAARTILAARQLGRVRSLSESELRKLAELRERLGVGAASDVFAACNIPITP